MLCKAIVTKGSKSLMADQMLSLYCFNCVFFRKQAIHSEKTFDFLRDLVKNVPDHQAEEEEGGLIASGSGVQEPKPKQSK